MYTIIRHELCHARKAWSGNLVDPCLLSGHTPVVCFRMLQAKGCPVYGSLEPDLGPCLPKLPKEKTIGKKFSFFTSHEI